MLATERDWVRGLHAAVLPGGVQRAYINASDFDADSVRIAYCDEKYQRLARIKRTYDPNNLFHLNSNIKPSP